MSAQSETRSAGSLQLGVQKYLYLGYFVAGFIVAYIVHQSLDAALGEGHDALDTAVGVVVAVAAVVFAWRNRRIHGLARDTVEELEKVTWPSRQETWTATMVVVVTAVVAAVMIFALDRFWGWFTEVVFR